MRVKFRVRGSVGVRFRVWGIVGVIFRVRDSVGNYGSQTDNDNQFIHEINMYGVNEGITDSRFKVQNYQ